MKKINHCFYYDIDLGGLKISNDSIFQYLSDFNTIYLDCGRSSLRIISKLYSNTEILLPDYTCASVIQGFPYQKLRFYHVNDDFTIDFDSLEKLINPNVKLVYVSQFCGKLLPKEQTDRLAEIKDKYNIKLVEDTTHSILSSALSFGDYGACALYKWFPSACGGVVYSRENLNNKEFENLRQRDEPQRVYAMLMQFLYRKGLINYSDAIDEYFDVFDRELTYAADNNIPLAKLPDFDRFLLSCCSVDDVRKKRKNNVKTLINQLNFDIIEPVYKNIDDTDCLLAYPIYTEKRNQLKDYLEKNEILTPVYWDMNKMKQFYNNEDSFRRSEKIIVLPVNQQYDSNDMRRMAEVINKWQTMI